MHTPRPNNRRGRQGRCGGPPRRAHGPPSQASTAAGPGPGATDTSQSGVAWDSGLMELSDCVPASVGGRQAQLLPEPASAAPVPAHNPQANLNYDSDSDADRCDVGAPTGILIVLLLYPKSSPFIS